MVAKRKDRVASTACSASGQQAERSESTAVDVVVVPSRGVEDIASLSDSDPIDQEQLDALRRRVADDEEYTNFLWRKRELEQEREELASSALRIQL